MSKSRADSTKGGSAKNRGQTPQSLNHKPEAKPWHQPQEHLYVLKSIMALYLGIPDTQQIWSKGSVFLALLLVSYQ